MDASSEVVCKSLVVISRSSVVDRSVAVVVSRDVVVDRPIVEDGLKSVVDRSDVAVVSSCKVGTFVVVSGYVIVSRSVVEPRGPGVVTVCSCVDVSVSLEDDKKSVVVSISDSVAAVMVCETYDEVLDIVHSVLVCIPCDSVVESCVAVSY